MIWVSLRGVMYVLAQSLRAPRCLSKRDSLLACRFAVVNDVPATIDGGGVALRLRA